MYCDCGVCGQASSKEFLRGGCPSPVGKRVLQRASLFVHMTAESTSLPHLPLLQLKQFRLFPDVNHLSFLPTDFFIEPSIMRSSFLFSFWICASAFSRMVSLFNLWRIVQMDKKRRSNKTPTPIKAIFLQNWIISSSMVYRYVPVPMIQFQGLNKRI